MKTITTSNQSEFSGKLLLHIGLPKTRTTTLQSLVFERHPDIRYFGQTNLWEDAETKAVLRALLLDNEPENNAQSIIRNALTSHKAVVISDEALTFGQFMLRAGKWPIVTDPKRIAERARHILGIVDVLIILRAQYSWLESWHRQGLKTGKFAETDFNLWLTRELKDNWRIYQKLLRYDNLYSAWVDAMGPRHVHIRFYEEYHSQFTKLAAESADIINVDEAIAARLAAGDAQNVTGSHFLGLPPVIQQLVRSDTGRSILAYIPKSLRQSLRKPFVRERRYASMRQSDKTSIKQYFSSSNRVLFSKLERPDTLEQYF